MRITHLIAAVTVLAFASPAAAFDLKAFSEKMLDCDGPGIVLAHRFAAEGGTADTEAEGYAALDMIDMLISKDGETAGLSEFARGKVSGIRDAAVLKAEAVIEKCGLEAEAEVPIETGVANPFVD